MKKVTSSALYSYERTYIENQKNKLFKNGTMVKKSALYVKAKNKVDAINELMKKCHLDIFESDELDWLNTLISKGYVYVSDDEEETFDPMTDIQYNYYCECVYEV